MAGVGDMSYMPSPSASLKGDINVAAGDEVSFKFQLDTGCFVDYQIYWGDGEEEFIGASHMTNPELFFKSHIYPPTNSSMLYNMTIVWYNKLTSRHKTIKIIAHRCIPTVTSSGSYFKEAAFEITRTQYYSVKAKYTFPSEYCRSEHEHNVDFPKWEVKNEKGDFQKTYLVSNKTNLLFEAKKKSLEAGLLSITLWMRWTWSHGVEDVPHTVYVYVFGLPLVSVIKDGSEAEKGLTEGSKTSAVEFILDGRESYDQEEPELKNQGLTYKWTCTVSPDSDVNDPCSKTNGNLDKFAEQAENGTILLNTGSFSSGRKYNFTLTVSKDRRSAAGYQAMEFLPSGPPKSDTK